MSIFYLDPENGNNSTTNTPLGWWSVPYTNGNGTEPVADELATGGSSGSTAYVTVVVVSSGTWAGGNAAGTLYWYGKSAAFSAETLTFGGGATCSIGADFTFCAWKDIQSGATAARIAPGDIIRIAKSPAPISIGDATWTNGSYTVTLDAARTAVIDNCESGWAAAAGGDCTTCAHVASGSSPYYGMEGDYSLRIVLDSSPQTNKLQAYKTISSTDFSAYQEISFYIKPYVGYISANNWIIKLCSDTAGATPVDEFLIPATALYPTQSFLALTIAKSGGGNLGSAIQSIALYTGSSAPSGSASIILDHFIATKTDDLNLTCMITKNPDDQGWDNGAWYNIATIDGVSVEIGKSVNDSASYVNKAPYYTRGTSPETVETYIRQYFKIDQVARHTNNTFAIQDTGNSVNLIGFYGGYDMMTNLQSGETIFSHDSYTGRFIYTNSKHYLRFEHICIYRVAYAFYVYASDYLEFHECKTIACQYGVSFYNSSEYNHVETIYSCNDLYGINAVSYKNLFIDYYHALSNGITALILSSSVFSADITEAYIDGAGNYGIQVQGGGHRIGTLDFYCSSSIDISFFNGIGVYIENLYTDGNDTGRCIDLGTSTTNRFLIKNLIATSLLAQGLVNTVTTDIVHIIYLETVVSEDYIFMFVESSGDNHYKGVATVQKREATGYSYYRAPYMKAIQQAATAGGTGLEWYILPSGFVYQEYYPFEFPVAKILCEGSKLVTAKIYIKKEHATYVHAYFVADHRNTIGLSAESSTEAPNDTNRNQVTITFTPSETCVVELFVRIWHDVAGISYGVFIDDIEVTQV